MKRLTTFIALSLATHLTLTGLLAFVDELKKDDAISPVTEIEIIQDHSLATPIKPLVKQLDAPKPIVNDDSLARFDSEKNQRVQRETQARNIGQTQNSNLQHLQNKIQKQQEKQIETKTDDMPEFTRMNLSNPNQPQSQESALSQVLPNDIQFSDATNLNTDANTYYSFYNRVEELFYVRWGERLNYYWDRLSYDFKKKQLAGKIWTTTLEVWLTATGEFHSAYIQKSSGYKPFDEATVFAFKDARFFPNPPRAKVEPDGFVRLRYRFNVHVGSLP